jgi:FkbH-like protein
MFPKEKNLSDYMREVKNLRISNIEKRVKIAILSSFTITGLAETIKVKCNKINVESSTYASGYNQFNQEILDSNSELYRFKPEITFLIIDSKNIFKEDYDFFYKKNVKERKIIVQEKIDEIINLAKEFVEKTNSKIIISNLSIPSYSNLGILETKDYGISQMILEFNMKLNDSLKNETSVYVYDLFQFFYRFGEQNIAEPHKIALGDIKISFNYIPYLAEEFMGYIKPYLGLNKKCIVLDLDNTLWGGIVGEDGFYGIKLGPDPLGNIFMDFQRWILALHDRGIILAINSKNNSDEALKVIKEHKHMILKEEDFASMKINWNDKIQNIKEISQEINIGLDSMVFFDDDLRNCEMMKAALPQVLTINLPKDPSLYLPIIQNMNDFNVLKITDEDKKRGEMYYHQKQRNELKNETTDLEKYLEKLETKVTIKKVDQTNIPRISQLTMKTNQFNLTTKRYSEEDIKNMVNDSKIKVVYAQVEDKFGDNGITSTYIIKSKNKKECYIDTFLLSCRIIGREVEQTIMSFIIKEAKKEGFEKVIAEFIPTKKNLPANDFLEKCGFEKEEKFWVFNTSKEFKKPSIVSLIVK